MPAAVKKQRASGLLITFEGIDFSGKSLQAELFYQRVVESGNRALALRDPGATSISEKIRAILLDNRHGEMSPWTELLLYEAARAQMIEQSIKPALQRGSVVVCDRLYDSTTAYQGYGRQLDLTLVTAANHIGACGLAPDMTLLIDLPVPIAAERKKQLKRKKDRMENAGDDFQQRVRGGYLKLAADEPGRIHVIQGDQPVELIRDHIWHVFTKRWPEFRD
ncbi:dTMP kinase [candidate division KSB1 bacterium]|nr:dTMP kinase [candidate division KSB1 bacterium]